MKIVKVKTEQTFLNVRKAANQTRCRRQPAESGFTLIETSIALLIMMIAALGAVSLFSFSINYNSGGSDRLVALALAQEQLERFRSAQFNSTTTDAILTGGTTTQAGLIRNGKRYALTITVDDNPATANVEVDATSTLKRITVAVAPETLNPGWSLNTGARITLITQRARSDR